MKANLTKLLACAVLLSFSVIRAGPASSDPSCECEAAFLSKEEQQAKQAQQVRDLRSGKFEVLYSLMEQYETMLRHAWPRDYPEMAFEDFKQEVSLHIIEKVKDGAFCEVDGSFTNWLKTVVRNKRADIVRRSLRKEEKEMPVEDIEKYTLDPSEGLEDWVRHGQGSTALLEWIVNGILPSLRPSLREFAEILIVDPGINPDQMAKQLGIAKTAVYKRMSDLKKELCQVLETGKT